MRTVTLALLTALLATSLALAADTDGDGISDEIETQLGLLPQVKQNLVLIQSSPDQKLTDEQAKTAAPDILSLEGCHVGGQRVLLKLTFARPVDFMGCTFIIYADLDNDPKTGRVDQYHGGVDTMFIFADRNLSFTFYGGHDNGNTGARMARDGNVLYVAIDAPFKQAADGKLPVGLHLLSQREGGRGDGTPHVVAPFALSTATVPKLALGRGGISRSPSEYRYFGDKVFYEKLSDKGLREDQVKPVTPIQFGRERPQVQYLSQGRQPGKRGSVDMRRVPVELLEEANVARQAAILSFGFPLPQGALFSLDKIKLVDGNKEVPAQFTATGFWPDDSLKWVLIDATVPLAAGERKTLAVVCGSKVVRSDETSGRGRVAFGNPSSIEAFVSALPTDEKTMPTLRFSIPTDKFRPFADVQQGGLISTWIVDGNPLRATMDQAGASIVDESGKTFSMGLSKPDRVIVEQNGWRKAVIRAEGAYTAADGSTYMRYTARMTFRAGSPLVETAITTLNDWQKTEFTDVTSLSLALKPTAGVGQLTTYLEGTASRLVAGPSDSVTQWDENSVAVGDRSHDGRGAGVVTWNGGGAVIHDFWQRYPKGIRLQDGQVVFDLLPQQPSADYGKDLPYWAMFNLCEGKYRFKWGMAFTEKISLDFSGKLKPEELWAEAQVPVVPVIPATWYAETRAIGPVAVPRGKQFAQWDKFVTDSYANYMAEKARSREYGFLNYGDWFGERGRNWGNNEYDLAHGLFMQFVRTGNRDLFRWATKTAQHRADVDTIWFYPDLRNVGANPPHSIGHTGAWTEITERSTWSCRYDGMYTASNGHNWCDGLMDDWMLTGNPRAMESGLAFGEHVAWAMAPSFTALGTHERSAGWSLRAIMAVYKATYDPVYLDAAKKIVAVALKEQKLDQGGAWPHVLPKDHAGWEQGAVGNNLFLIGILLGGLQAYHEETQDPAVLKSLEAGAAWVAKCFDEKAGGWPYSCKADGTPLYKASTSLDQLIIGALAYVGRVTKNEQLLHIASEAMAAATSSSPGGSGKGMAQFIFFTSGTLAELQQYYARTLPDKGVNVLDGSPESMARLLIRTATSDRHSVRAPDQKVFYVENTLDMAELTLRRTPHGAMNKRAEFATVQVLGLGRQVVWQNKCSTDEAHEFTVPVTGKGAVQYKVIIDDDQRGVWSLSGDHVQIVAQTSADFRIGGVGRSRFYFMVPQGTKEFSLRLVGVHTGPYGAVVLDPAEQVAGTFQGNNPGAALIVGAAPAAGGPPPGHPELGTLTIKPPATQTGKIWSVILTAAGDIGISLEGVPPYLALSPEAWFEVE
ncbi:hypothetical protein LLH23_13430 [bacterium]|nr:hypothetical protein [bacterium]